MKNAILRLAVLAAMAGIGPVAHAALPNGIAAGDVTQTSAVLWGRTDSAGRLSFQCAADRRFQRVVARRSFTVTDPLVPAKWTLTELSPATTYYYRVTDGTGASATGSFRTPTALGHRRGLRFGVSGDWRGELLPYPAVQNADDRSLDFFVALGDTIYGDVPSAANGGQQQAQTLAEFRGKHAEVYGELGGLNALGDLRASTAVFATIDDHEVTNDFAGAADVSTDPRFAADPAGTPISDSTLYDNALRAFQDYNPIRPRYYPAGGEARSAGEIKLYRSQNFGSDAALFVLDARSFRDDELPGADPGNPLSVGQFLAAAFDPTRTLLGRRQVEELKADLLKAHHRKITWKFIMVPEPIQNLGIFGAADRFEGYAAERTEILKFIADSRIDNVVFVTADIHGTLVNNLTYQLAPFTAQISTNTFEISTGAVAYDAPFGPTVAQLGAAAGLISPAELAFYGSLPVANDADSVPNDKDDFLKAVVNGALAPLGYDPVGIENTSAAQLLVGDYMATHSYGWTEFEIAKESQELVVTTYGIPAYTAADIAADLAGIAARTPQIVSQFKVTPQRTSSD
jgi:phosphodiesterase/alkaline phosphatase D-like protein